MKKIAFARQLIKRLTTPFTQPTIPSSNDHTDGTWVDTDLYSGEMCLNTSSREFTMRVNGLASDTIDYIHKTTSFNVLSGIATKFQTYSQISQTTDDTPTVVGSFNFSTYKSFVGTVKVYGYEDGSPNKMYFREVNLLYDIVSDATDNAYEVSFNMLGVGADAIINHNLGIFGIEVTGVSATNINWFVEYDLTLFL
jgi:hypothetical protein